MTRKRIFDRASWLVQAADGEPFPLETTHGTTWALRALVAAGAEGLHPIDTSGGRWAHLIDRLRGLGVLVDDLPENDEGRRGYRLAVSVRRAG